MPNMFIPQSETTGLIHSITHLVLESVLNKLSMWNELGIDFNISVNISPRNLHDDNLLRLLEEHIKNINPNNLVIEITERAVVSDVDYLAEVLGYLRAMGLKISIDDYGTGYTSLLYFKKLPIDNLKIDRTFISNILKNKHDREIVKTTISLCKKLGITVTAEGVEDEEILLLLREFGCDYVQGYLFSRPFPESELPRWIDNSIIKVLDRQ